ncbi:MAG: GNAT family N-acetyltransferase [Chitinophagaceae bacterium]|nr:GNAT family N-acetyltransferase [Chitinophagaceae bacterium]
MIFREAYFEDVPQMQVVRNSVKENKLSDPALITNKGYGVFLKDRGKGWVCQDGSEIVGFAVADLYENNIWALFVRPDYEGKGIGKKLQQLMLDWYFNQTTKNVVLGTSPGTRAEQFYRKSGWKEVGTHGKGEIKFQMSFEELRNMKKNCSIEECNATKAK